MKKKDIEIDYIMKLDQTLNALIEERGISVSFLAKKTGVSNRTLFNWQNGAKPKDILQVKRVADFFEVSINRLLILW